MEARDFREAIKPIIEQYAGELFPRSGRRSSVETLIKRQTTQAVREVVAPLASEYNRNQHRQRELYS